MRVLREGDGWEITLAGPALSRAGETSVYAVPDHPDLAAKIYHNPKAEQAGKLAAMLATPPVPRAGNGHMALAWPVARLLETGAERRVAGYLMPRLEQAPLLWEVYNPEARLQVYPQFHYASLLRTARNLAAVVATLHRSGYVIGDLNESSVVVTPQALPTLIDVDSFQVRAGGQLHRCRVGRAEYAPPELQGVRGAEGERQPEHDAFALAVLIFRLLMQGAHPFAGACAESGKGDSIPARIAAGSWPYAWERPGPDLPSPHAPPWSVLPPAVAELLRCCFEDARQDPGLRPGAARWQKALEEAENDLSTCPRNTQHRYARGLDVCPWCLLARQQGRDPFPPLQLSVVSCQLSEKNRRPVCTDNCQPTTDNCEGEKGKPGLVEAGLRMVGSLVERHGWVAWFGAILVGTVAGLLWALQHAAAPAAKDQTLPETAERREGEPAQPEPAPLLPRPLTLENRPADPPPAPVGFERPEKPVPARPGPPLEEDNGVAEAARNALPPNPRPPVSGPRMTLSVCVVNGGQFPQIWPEVEGKLKSLADAPTPQCKVSTSGDCKWVELSPVESDADTFSRKIKFAKVTATNNNGRIVYIKLMR